MADSRDLPLLRWGEELRRAALFRRSQKRRRLIDLAVVLIITALLLTIVWKPRPLLVWNASASSPMGLYAVSAPQDVSVGDVVVAWAPEEARRLGAERHYIPINVPLVKSVAAGQGDTVCAIGETIFINGRSAALRVRADGQQRELPWWSGCVQLRGGELFLMSRDVPGAFDGRYFGITTQDRVVGKARLLWRA